MKNRIALLVESPFSPRDFERFGVATLQQAFEVDVIDLTQWINPKVWKKFSHIVFKMLNYRTVATMKQCRKEFVEGHYAFAFDYLSQSAKADLVRNELKFHSISRITVCIGLVPVLPRKTIFQQLASLKYRTNRLFVLVSWLRKFAQSSRKNSMPPEIAVITGVASLDDPALKSARKIWAHSPDYDSFLAIKGGHDWEKSGRRKYAVYADEDCAFHPDFLHDNIRPFVQAEVFYPVLMRFFRKFEEESGMEVIIAAHPRSQWDKRSKFLDGRIPVKGKTAELISGAHVVFAHASTSIAFAILWRVPLVFLTSDAMDDSFYRDEVRMRSAFFDAPLLNIDHSGNVERQEAAQAKIKEPAYAEYRERYIKKSGTPDIPMWDIFVSEMLGEAKS